MNESKELFLREVIAVSDLPDLEDNIPTRNEVKHYPELLNNVDFCCLTDKRVRLLIGANVQAAHRVVEARYGTVDQTSAVRSVLGWSLVGPAEDDLVRGKAFSVSYVKSDNIALNEAMQRMYDTDFVTKVKTDSELLSVNDRRALDIMEKSIKKVDGHYQVALPWKSDQISFPNNRIMALRRLNQLKKRFLKDPAFFERYREKIESYLSNGYAQQVSLDAGISMKAWYLPHHAVQEKFRVVFDCGASYKGTSLNSQLLHGPDQTSSLIGVLLRFRRGEVAVMADVKAIFHQVRVEPDDAESLRFLWWPKSDFSLPSVDFQMLVHIFGATSSPSVCSFALKRAALDNETGASEQTVSSVSKSFYVDDFLGSFLSMEEATSVLKQLRLPLSNCGFRMTKFVSNFKCVLEDIPQEDKRLNLETTEVLGLPWHIHSDTLSVDVEISSKEITRRGILSMISQIFDPLGFLQPFLLPVKKLLQELAVDGLGWDDPIPEKQSCYWEKWFRCLSGLTQLNLPRAYFPHGFQPVDVQLHCFSDANQSGYGAVAYLRSENNLGQVKCSFVMGRSRVTPVKPITIPRLELSAAVVAVELVQMLKRELDVEIADVYFWTDSTSVLRYIRSTAKRFHQFVANRIAAIQSGSTACQ